MKGREPQSHLYYDKKADDFSNVALGILARAIGHNLRITYYNSKRSIFRIIFGFRKSLIKNINFYDYYSFHEKQLSKSELVILDCYDSSRINIKNLVPILNNNLTNCEIIIITNNYTDYKKLKKNFNLVSEYKYKNNNSGYSNIINITGNGKGKSTYAFGFALRQIIDKKNIKFIYFDKGGDFYTEKYFFDKLRKVNANFNYVSFGLSRIQKNGFRFENLPEDIKEAKKGLEEIRKSSAKDIIIADELNTTINSRLLSEDEVVATLFDSENQILVSGRYATKEVLKLAKTQIEVQEVKHYSSEGKGVRKGIDY